MLGRARQIVFPLIVFCLSFQVGLHFWPEFAYVNGVRIDYLSPTLHLLDILVVSFIVLSIPSLKRIPFQDPLFKLFLFLFGLSAFLNILLSASVDAHIFGLIKLGEFALFAVCVVKVFNKNYIPTFILALALSGLFSSALAIWQFINQGSVGGAFYLIGERTFSASTIGVSTVNIGQQLLRPYAAFAHPNLLSFFLLTEIVFVLPRIRYENALKIKAFYLIAIVFSTIAVLLTFSRVSILLLILFYLYQAYLILQKSFRRLFLVASLLILLTAGIFLPKEFLFRGVDFREELLNQSWIIFVANPAFGVGGNNFFIAQMPLINEVSAISFQPPHNIYVLWLLQFGVLGFFILPYFVYLAIRSLLQKVKVNELSSFRWSVLLVLLSIMAMGMFDHFFITLEQGQLILALILGLSCVNFASKRGVKPPGK